MGKKITTKDRHIDIYLTDMERLVIESDTGDSQYARAIEECLENCFYYPWAKKFEWWTSDNRIALKHVKVTIEPSPNVYYKLEHYCRRRHCTLEEGVKRLIFGYGDEKR